MITLHAKEWETWDEKNEQFILHPAKDLIMEHSLAAIAEWEGKWKKPYLSSLKMYEKTPEEVLDYFHCMILDKTIPIEYLMQVDKDDFLKLKNYLEDSHSAARFSKKEGSYGHKSGLSKNGEDTTAETIYYQMSQLNIPFECDKWNVNRLLSLINYCTLKQEPGKKMSERDIIKRNAMLNNIRRAKSGSKG